MVMLVPCDHEWDLRETTGGPPLEVRCIKCGSWRDEPDATVSLSTRLGWKCPACKTCYPPWVGQCHCSVRSYASNTIAIRG